MSKANGVAQASIKVLSCSSEAISFPAGSQDAVPQISDPATLTNLKTAAEYLKQGRLVAFPTETVYGLGGSALAGSDAIPKIFVTKGRPSDNPLIVHIASRKQLHALIDPGWKDRMPICYAALMDKFWPGPLTLLFPTTPGKQVSERVTCGLKTVGVRMPSHPVARALLALSGIPLAAPSANTSGRPSTTQARHVASDLAGKSEPACILDGGECDVGVESTVVSALPEDGAQMNGMENLRVLRLGGVSPEDLDACIEQAGLSDKVSVILQAYEPHHETPSGTNGYSTSGNFIPSTPGMKYKHYSPDAKVLLVHASKSKDGLTLDKLLEQHQGNKIGLLHLEDSAILRALREQQPDIICASIGREGAYEQQAASIFSGLRLLDELHADLIIVEAVKEEGLGRTVMERLRKAAGGGEREVAVLLP